VIQGSGGPGAPLLRGRALSLADPRRGGIAEGDIVELIAGPFKGEKARVQRIDEGKDQVTVELYEATVPIPVTVRGDHPALDSDER